MSTTDDVTLFIKARDEASKAMQNVQAESDRLAAKFDSLSINVKDLDGSLGSLGEMDAAADAMNSLDDAGAELEEGTKSLTDGILGQSEALTSQAGKYAGLAAQIAAAGAAGFAFGSWISGFYDKHEEFNANLLKSDEYLKAMKQSMSDISSDQQFELQFEKTGADKIAKLEEMVEAAEKELSGSITSRDRVSARFDEYNTWENNWLRINKKIQEVEKKSLDESKEVVEERTKALKELRKQLHQTQRVEEEAAKAKVAKEKEDKEKKAADEAKKRADDELKMMADRTTATQNYIKSLQEQNETFGMGNDELAFRKGLELSGGDYEAAAEAERLQRELDAKKAAAEEEKRIAQEFEKSKEQALRKAEQMQKKQAADAEKLKEKQKKAMKETRGPVAAFESRFLTRGTGRDDPVEEQTKRTADTLEKIAPLFEESGPLGKLLAAIRDKQPWQIKEVTN